MLTGQCTDQQDGSFAVRGALILRAADASTTLQTPASSTTVGVWMSGAGERESVAHVKVVSGKW